MNYNSVPNWNECRSCSLSDPGVSLVGMQIWQCSRSRVKRENLSWNYRHVTIWDQNGKTWKVAKIPDRTESVFTIRYLDVTHDIEMNFHLLPHRSPWSRNLSLSHKNVTPEPQTPGTPGSTPWHLMKTLRWPCPDYLEYAPKLFFWFFCTLLKLLTLGNLAKEPAFG